MELNLAKYFFKILVTDTSEEKELKQSIFEIASVLKEGVVEQLVVYNKKMTSKYLKDLQTTSAKFILISEEELRAKSYIEIYNALWSIGSSLVELFNKEKVKDLGEGIEKTVRWYLDNQEWMDNITSGEYEKYYEEMYKGR